MIRLCTYEWDLNVCNCPHPCVTSLSLHSMTVKTNGISIIPTSPECTIYTRPKVLSGHLKITIHFSFKHALPHLLSYHVKYDERTKIVPVSICTLSLHFAIEML